MRQGYVAAGIGMLGMSLVGAANAALMIDLRAESVTGSGISMIDAHNVTITSASASGTVSIGVYAVVTGADATLTNDGFQYVNGRIKSTNVNGNANYAVLGGIASVLTGDYSGSGSSNGSATDLDSDGDFDLGVVSNSTTVGQWYPRAAGSTMAMPASGLGNKLATLTFTLSSVNALAGASDITRIEFDRRANSLAGLWILDGANTSGVISGGTSKNFAGDTYSTQGVNMLVSVPEPATMGLMGLGSLALLRRKRSR